MGCAAAGEPLSTSCQDFCSSVPAGCQDLAWVCTCPARVALCRAAGQGVAGIGIGVATCISIGSAASPSTGFPGLGDMGVRGHHQLGKVSGRPAPGAAGEALGAGKKRSGLQTLQRCCFRFPSPWGAAFPKGFSISGSHTMRFPFSPSPG